MRISRYGRKKAMDTAKDSYLNKVSPEDNTRCHGCGALYHNKRWSLNTLVTPAEKGEEGKLVFCPACQKIHDGFARGFVTLEGAFVLAHSDEIVHLIRNKERRAMYHNPLERIIEIKDTAKGMKVTTTTEKLAQRIGAILKKAYKGQLEYKWSDGVKLARVTWVRDE
ncbi:MAG: BCAM0308 family protein [Thermodesulfobacteriota bacterium]